eukprot:TRINITY_DN13058_c0_g1_i1.p1 TRINITY_DN13058_c0_g1~~TRINITY_DN13058_c0_g1_i1.p1  ORF type:complete len:272 (-),score=81.18 TRINITY_DN13058_c0_g1_i1:133-948(-)
MFYDSDEAPTDPRRRSALTGRAVEAHSSEYFAVSAVGGALASAVPYALLTPLELIKTNIQVHPNHFHSLLPSWYAIKDGVAELGFRGGVRSLTAGLGATLAGYTLHGGLQFGLYEVFRYRYAQMLGEDNWLQHKSRVWMAAAASAETVATLALCPFETTRARLQAQPQFARGLFDGLPKLIATDGFAGLYVGLGPLLLRQLPLTVARLTTFESMIESLYKVMPREPEDLSGREKVAVMFWAGGIVGALAAVLSQPADTLFSLIANDVCRCC